MSSPINFSTRYVNHFTQQVVRHSNLDRITMALGIAALAFLALTFIVIRSGLVGKIYRQVCIWWSKGTKEAEKKTLEEAAQNVAEATKQVIEKLISEGSKYFDLTAEEAAYRNLKIENGGEREVIAFVKALDEKLKPTLGKLKEQAAEKKQEKFATFANYKRAFESSMMLKSSIAVLRVCEEGLLEANQEKSEAIAEEEKALAEKSQDFNTNQEATKKATLRAQRQLQCTEQAKKANEIGKALIQNVLPGINSDNIEEIEAQVLILKELYDTATAEATAAEKLVKDLGAVAEKEKESKSKAEYQKAVEEGAVMK